MERGGGGEWGSSKWHTIIKDTIHAIVFMTLGKIAKFHKKKN